jgi:hypothetical protein
MRLALSKEGAPSPLSVRQWFMFGTLIVWIVWAMTTESSSSSAAPLSISSADETYSTPPAQAHGRMTAETPSKSGDSDYDTIPGQYIVTYTDWTIFNATATMLELLQEFAQEALSLTDEELETILGDVHILHHYHTEALAGVTMSGVWSAPLIAFWQDHPLIHSVEAVRRKKPVLATPLLAVLHEFPIYVAESSPSPLTSLFLFNCHCACTKDSRVSLDAITAKNLQYNPPNWGLDRIDESSMAVGRQQSKAALNREYAFDQTGKGSSVHVGRCWRRRQRSKAWRSRSCSCSFSSTQ